MFIGGKTDERLLFVDASRKKTNRDVFCAKESPRRSDLLLRVSLAEAEDVLRAVVP